MANKSSGEGYNLVRRFIVMDQLFRSSEGATVKQIIDSVDEIIEPRTVKGNIATFKEKFGAKFDESSYRGRETVHKYADPNFSIIPDLGGKINVLRAAIQKLEFFKGEPHYDMLRFYMKVLENRISSDGKWDIILFDNNKDVKGLKYFDTILSAIINKHPLKMLYEPFGGKMLDFNIHPYQLRQYNRRWWLFASAETKDDENRDKRVYPLDRIKSLKPLSKKYIECDIDIDKYFEDVIGMSNYMEQPVENILIRVDKNEYNYIITKPFHHSQKLVESTDDFVTIELKVKVNTELKMLLFSYSDYVEVLEPAYLRAEFKSKIKKMSERYKDNAIKIGD